MFSINTRERSLADTKWTKRPLFVDVCVWVWEQKWETTCTNAYKSIYWVFCVCEWIEVCVCCICVSRVAQSWIKSVFYVCLQLKMQLCISSQQPCPTLRVFVCERKGMSPVWKPKGGIMRWWGVIFIPVPLVMVHGFHGAPNKTEGIRWTCSTVERESGREREVSISFLKNRKKAWMYTKVDIFVATKALRTRWKVCTGWLVQKILFSAQTFRAEPFLSVLIHHLACIESYFLHKSQSHTGTVCRLLSLSYVYYVYYVCKF